MDEKDYPTVVPQPLAGQQNNFLCNTLENLEWLPATTYDLFLCANGYWKYGNKVDLFLCGDGTWKQMSL